MLWAPIYSHRSRCPFNPEKVWTSAIIIPLKWMAAFLSGARGTLRRTYYLADFMGSGDDVEIVCDASPTGIGAFLVEQVLSLNTSRTRSQPKMRRCCRPLVGTPRDSKYGKLYPSFALSGFGLRSGLSAMFIFESLGTACLR